MPAISNPACQVFSSKQMKVLVLLPLRGSLVLSQHGTSTSTCIGTRFHRYQNLETVMHVGYGGGSVRCFGFASEPLANHDGHGKSTEAIMTSDWVCMCVLWPSIPCVVQF
ncbi:hypothetical protein B0I35DRAFT_122407 [Stachybotrys elegans]|uniref:Uncharacterized protein n=1 Tax=Stachybotrys elegans TaxID=80388 RepID=A0A8K0WV94_9HYPO|nr:hypothetical protein B0I35DRAFT_122407 [Stachybotrys elegans]